MLWAGLGFAEPGLPPEPAQEASEPFRVELTAPNQCPAEEHLLEAILRRTTRARVAAAGEPARPLRAEIKESKGKLEGVLHLTLANGESLERTAEALHCEDLVDALGLIVAISIDPTVLDAGSSGTPEPSLVCPAPPEVSPATAPCPLLATPSNPPLRRHKTPEAVPRPGAFALGIGMDLRGGLAPAPTTALRAFATFGWNREALISPSLELSVARAQTSLIHTEPVRAEADLEWLAARAALCPLNLTPSSTSALRPCAFIEAGTLSGQGRSTTNVEATQDPVRQAWLSSGLLLRLETVLVGHFAIRMEAGVGLQPHRLSMGFANNSSWTYKTPFAAGLLGVGTAFVF